MGAIAFCAMPRTSPLLQGRIKLARLLEMPEREFEDRVREVESDRLFRRLVDAGVVSIEPYPRVQFFARSIEGRELRASNDGLPELLDGQGDLAKLIARVGRERFEQLFLQDEALSDDERARLCGIAPSDAGRLRALVDRLYVQAEFEDPTAQSAPAPVYSAVAGIEVQAGRPVLGFFSRDIWKGRYRIDDSRQREVLAALPLPDARRLERLIRRIELLNSRKSTLFRLLETLLEAQAEYLTSGELGRRRPVTQRAIAASLAVAPSVLNRVIANKSVRLPWGVEVPLKSLLPNSKTLVMDRVYELALEYPDLSDGALREEVRRVCDANLSRRRIADYRKELGLGPAGHRVIAVRVPQAVAAP